MFFFLLAKRQAENVRASKWETLGADTRKEKKRIKLFWKYFCVLPTKKKKEKSKEEDEGGMRSLSLSTESTRNVLSREQTWQTLRLNYTSQKSLRQVGKCIFFLFYDFRFRSSLLLPRNCATPLEMHRWMCNGMYTCCNAKACTTQMHIRMPEFVDTLQRHTLEIYAGMVRIRLVDFWGTPKLKKRGERWGR